MSDCILSFKCEQQRLTRLDSALVAADAAGVIVAQFELCPKWSGLDVYARFQHGAAVYDVPLEDGAAIVPWEVLKPSGMYVSLFGEGTDGARLTSARVLVPVADTISLDGVQPIPPSPSLLERFENEVLASVENAAESREAAESAAADAATAASEAEQSQQNAESAQRSAQRAQNSAASAQNSAASAQTDAATAAADAAVALEVKRMADAGEFKGDPGSIDNLKTGDPLLYDGEMLSIGGADTRGGAFFNLANGGDHLATANWNELTTPGIYRVLPGTGTLGTGAPSASMIRTGQVIVFQPGVESRVVQIYIPVDDSPLVYVRSFTTTWTSWGMVKFNTSGVVQVANGGTGSTSVAGARGSLSVPYLYNDGGVQQIARANGSRAGYLKVFEDGITPYTSGGAGNVGNASWPFLTVHARDVYEDGTKLTAKYQALTGETHTEIPAGADLNTYTTPGNYCNSTTKTGSDAIVNAPTQNLFYMQVLRPFANNQNYIRQVAQRLDATINMEPYTRYSTNGGTSWTSWNYMSLASIRGTLPISKGGTGATGAAVARNNLDAAQRVPGIVSAYAGTEAPTGYIMCRGQRVSRTTYAKLYAVIGDTYGAGDGSTTFNVPDLQSRVPVGMGAFDSEYEPGALGTKGGTPTHTLTVDEIPAHSHALRCRNLSGTETGSGRLGENNYFVDESGQVRETGGGAEHNNMQPFIVLNYIISTGL